jgi:hypothetical protein
MAIPSECKRALAAGMQQYARCIQHGIIGPGYAFGQKSIVNQQTSGTAALLGSRHQIRDVLV